jgi:hypothetical protein
MTLVLRFQLQQFLSPHTPGSSTYRIPQHNFNGLRILLADLLSVMEQQPICSISTVVTSPIQPTKIGLL